MAGQSATEMNEQLRIAFNAGQGCRRILDASGADMRYRDVIGNTPLHNAVIFWGDAA